MSVQDKSWERLGYYIERELEKVAVCQEKQAEEIEGVATDLKVMRSQLILGGTIATIFTSGVVSLIVGLIVAYVK